MPEAGAAWRVCGLLRRGRVVYSVGAMTHGLDDTIAAIATAPGEGSVAVVRMSGPETYRIADEVFRTRGPPPSRRQPWRFAYGGIEAVDGGLIDEVLMLFMRAPRSYTREDMVEIQSHGGAMAARRILRRLLRAGARLAEPGEFTRRAFLNGRLDLMQAEAVLDVIRSRSERAAAAAEEQLAGGLSRRFNALYDGLLALAADLEATLDFPEDELPETVFADLAGRLAAARAEAARLLDTWDEGHLLRDGAVVVISGRPNAGKSTLMNRLLGTDRAITSSTPGTTRDSIEEGFVLNGIPLRLVDTAGLRETQCEIEQEGIRRTEKHLQTADIKILMLDSCAGIDASEAARLAALNPACSLVVVNKIDLGDRVADAALRDLPRVRTDLRAGTGLDRLREVLAGMLEGRLDLSARPHAVISERHRRLLEAAMADLDEAAARLAAGEDQALLAAEGLRGALERIGEATGRVYHDELLDSIFSRFCIGK